MRELTVEEIRSCVVAGGIVTSGHITGGGGAVVTAWTQSSGSPTVPGDFSGAGGGGTGAKSPLLHSPTDGGGTGGKLLLPPESKWSSKRNNPGDLKWAPWEAKFGGQPTQGSSFTTFATEQDGINALQALLSSYGSLTIDGMISAYAPPQSNPTAAYQSDVTSWTGLSGSTVISSLDAEQMDALVYAMARQESVTTF